LYYSVQFVNIFKRMVKANDNFVAKKVTSTLKSPPILRQVLIFLEEVRLEMGKVVWPTRSETIKMTLIVIGVSVAVGTMLGGLDFLLTQLTNKFLLK